MTTYSAQVRLPDGVTLSAEIDVPDEAAYSDQDECSEIAQSGVIKLKGIYMHNREPELPF